MTDNVQEQPTATATAVQSGTEEAALTINDLTTLKSIIDVAAQRGAFKPAEMSAVGTVYTKLATFLDQVSKKQQ